MNRTKGLISAVLNDRIQDHRTNGRLKKVLAAARQAGLPLSSEAYLVNFSNQYKRDGTVHMAIDTITQNLATLAKLEEIIRA